MSITTLPPSPSRANPSTFSALADALLGALPTFVTEANALETNVNAKEFSADAAADSAAISQANANFVGLWSDQSGAAVVPYSVSHSSRYWMLLSDLADVTSNEPGVSADWQEIGTVFAQDIINLAAKGPAYFLSGDGTYIELADNTNLDMDTNDFSVEIAFTPANVTDTGKRLISKTDGTTGFEIVINEDDLQVAILDNANNVTLTDLATAIFSAGKRSHVEVTFDRDGNIRAYHGGKPVGTPVSCTAIATIANASVLRIGTETGGTTNEFTGEVNKVRIRNLVSTPDEARENYSDSAVQYKHVGASQTELLSASGFGNAQDDSDFENAGADGTDIETGTDWVKVNTSSEIDNEAGSGVTTYNGSTFCAKIHTATDDFPRIQIEGANLDAMFTIGKFNRIYFDYKVENAPNAQIRVFGSGAGSDEEKTISSTSWVTDFIDITIIGNNDMQIHFYSHRGSDETGNEVLWVDNVRVFQQGCVLQLEQPGIGHGQWTDMSGNEAEVTVNGAIPINLPPDHTELYTDLTLTGNSSYTLPKGYEIESVIAKETAGNALVGGLDSGFSTNGTEVISGMPIGANATVKCTLVSTGVLGATHTTADDEIFFSDGNDNAGWDGAELEVRVTMKRRTVN